jgi:hypothetical protein
MLLWIGFVLLKGPYVKALVTGVPLSGVVGTFRRWGGVVWEVLE